MSKTVDDSRETLENLRKSALNAAYRITPDVLASTFSYVRSAQKNLNGIKSAMREAFDYASFHVTIPQEVEWLLDNWYIAEREGKAAIADLRSCPRLRRDRLKRRPVVAQAAHGLVRFRSGAMTAEWIGEYLDAFQDVICLSEVELSAFLPVLRLEIIALLSEACQRLKSVIRSGDTEEGLKSVFENCFKTLRFLSGFDASETLEGVNRVERTLRKDPSGVYAAMDEQTRFSYRREIARIARRLGISEHAAAEEALRLSLKDGSHVGQYIFKRPLGREKKSQTGSLYIGFIVLASLAISLLIGFLMDEPAVFLLLLLPVSELVKNALDYAVLRLVPPRRVPRLELKEGIPAEGKTLCVISLLLSSPESGARAAGLLEEYMLANRDAGKNLLFGILGDLPDAPESPMPGDARTVGSAEKAIERLNEKYKGGFFLFCRSRRYNARDGRYMAWERKRGAILELCRFLRGEKSGLKFLAGEEAALSGVRYLITLDSDTRLCAGTARELVGCALHPLNRPEIDPERLIVTSGAGIIQPRISVDLAAAGQTRYTRLFAGLGGIDPYGGLPGDIYQNLFGTGSFTGKGLIDIDAYLACLSDRFPENAVLSHDLLEGAFLRCVFAGDIELTDGYPARVTTYYDRMHRWTRGDWQAMPWLFRRVRTATGTGTNNLGQVDRWKIADNLRRSLVPVFTFASLALGMLLDNSDLIWVSAVAALSTFSNLVIASAAGVFSRQRCRVRYHSAVVCGFGGQVLQTAVKLALLPYEAWVCAHAIITALFRMFVSHRHLLDWVTAADAEKRAKNSLLHVLERQWPSVLICLSVAAATPFHSARAISLVWSLSPLLTLYLSKSGSETKAIDLPDRRLLSRHALAIWRYFDEMMTRDEHCLPPDNFQEQPAVGVAHRTSPTNIGLALLSSLAAYDLGACTKERAVEVIRNLLDTVETLPKWNGHLYNWYDTQTLKVLQPAYVSTVDSGNFAGCLIALREGLLELGEQGLADRANLLLSQMSFAPLFDEKRMLFFIGIDTTKGVPTEGWYDLLASEARQTSYIAIARGDVPRKHWRRLGRSLVSKDGYRGMASWTGTMFEYLMPELLLPCYRNSLIYESLKFCLYVQKKRASKMPWGMSESAFYAFDHTLSYRYKAHGVQALALKRGMGREAVVSPYSTYLALMIDPKGAVRNLRRLERLGMEGRYGLYEAVDFTQSRLRGSRYEVVRTYMAHHLGMSLIAIDNALNSGIMQRRFMRDREMASFAELLQEKVPVGGIVLRQQPRDVPEKPARAPSHRWAFARSSSEGFGIRCATLGNGAYSVLFCETGHTRSVWNGVAMTRASADPFGPEPGMAFFLASGGEVVSLLPSPLFDSDVRYSTELSGSCCHIEARSGTLHASVSAIVPENEAGELRVVEISSAVPRDAEIICYFEPVLARQSDYESHPAFSKLSLETSLCDGSVVVRRRPRAKGRGIALAFDCDFPFSFDTSREAALGRGGIFSLKSALSRPASGSLGSVLDPCVMLRISLRLLPNAPCRVRFALTTASTPQAASAAAKRVLSSAAAPACSRLDETAQRLKLTAEQTEKAMSFLPLVAYPPLFRKISPMSVERLGGGQKGLWSLGISGDLPVAAVQVESAADIERAEELLDIHALLAENGALFDLVFLVRGGGDYHSTLREAVLEAARKRGADNRLGASGGVHLADADSDGAQTALAVSVLDAAGLMPEGYQSRKLLSPRPRQFVSGGGDSGLKYGFNNDGSFFFDARGMLPLNAWSHVLANESFGFLATDAGTGHMWHINSRENKLNRWLNDSLTTEGTEKLELVTSNGTVSLFAAPDGQGCKVTYGFGWAMWEKTIDGAVYRTTAFVPHDIPARVLIIEREGGGSLEVMYFTDLLLAPDEKAAVYVCTEHAQGMISARNPYNSDFPDTIFRVASSGTEKAFTCSKASYLAGRLDGETGCGFLPCAAAVYEGDGALVIAAGCCGQNELLALCNLENAKKKLLKTRERWAAQLFTLTVKTPFEDLDRYLNGWAAYQTLACRLYARTSLYQSGGAYGFRDQLQDVCAIVDIAPEVARAHIIRAAEHQYEEGDVQHWWHPSGRRGSLGDKGVRTRCSDDLLWLPYALCVYAEKTGDDSIFEVPVSYISSSPLSGDEHERYEQPSVSRLVEPLISHAVRAVDLVISRGVGRHGLALIGTGDWNDGMNLVGAGGQGESVWLTWFACVTATKMADACARLGNHGAAARFQEAARDLKRAAEEAWDGAWYRRGYYDDGSPLGSCTSEECQIDSIAQSFAAFAGADAEKTKTALISSVERLFDPDGRIVRLFDPPFSAGSTTPGYIKGYSPGFRENGGQYTHGAVWLAMGLFMSGMTDDGWRILRALLPSGRDNAVYRVEPYVLAADVYTAPGHYGRGGWTWYTGAAGWFRRVALENLLGLQLRGNVLHVVASLPSGWSGYEAVWRRGGTSYTIRVDESGQVSVERDGPDAGGVIVSPGGGA